MRKSMTAYGRAILHTDLARWTLEISSVNRKGLDIHLFLPQSLLFLDPTVRKWVSQIAQRGNITVRVLCELKRDSHLIERLKAEKKRWEQISAKLNYPLGEITLPFLLEQVAPQEVVISEPSFEREMAQVWKKASKAWNKMKEEEGLLLIQDIQARLKIIQKETKEIEKKHPLFAKEYLAKLFKRMEELKLTIDPQELQREAALRADRSDITEEITRLKSHLGQMILYLKSSQPSVGRTLDFLSQEMGREIGTLMAKTGSPEIAKRAIKIKSEIEKIREQVQNIE